MVLWVSALVLGLSKVSDIASFFILYQNGYGQLWRQVDSDYDRSEALMRFVPGHARVRFFERRKAAYQAFVEKSEVAQPLVPGKGENSSKVSLAGDKAGSRVSVD